MEMGSFDVKAEPDRFSTCDEIRAALSFLPDLTGEGVNDNFWEVPSDLGGYVLIDFEKNEVLTLIEQLDTSVN